MPAPNPIEYISNSLSPAASKVKNQLLATSLISLFTSHAGVIPKQIEFLGIILTDLNQKSLLQIIAAIIVYYVVLFGVYGGADFLVWRTHQHKYLSMKHSEPSGWDQIKDAPLTDGLSENIFSPKIDHFLTTPIAYARVAFDFFFPVALGIYAIFRLLY